MVESKKTDRSAWWLAVAGTVGVIVGAIITGAFNHFDHASELDAKMIELTAGILRSKPDPETMPLRDWAIDTLQKRAHFQFTPEQIAILKNKKLPYTGWFDVGDAYSFDEGSSVPRSKKSP
jgi:hypothetical protein